MPKDKSFPRSADKLSLDWFNAAIQERAAVDAIPLALERMPGIASDWMLDQAPRAGEIITEQAGAFVRF